MLRVLRANIEQLEEGLVAKHDDSRAGLPDITVTLWGKTSWWEVKYAKPYIRGTDLQATTAKRLARAGDCRYIVFTDTGTHIVQPRHVVGGRWTPTASCEGHSYAFVLAFIRSVHRVQSTV